MRMGKGKPMRRASVKLNYRMVLCIAVLVLLLLTIIFGGLFLSLIHIWLECRAAGRHNILHRLHV